jgi:hypothetical protein
MGASGAGQRVWVMGRVIDYDRLEETKCMCKSVALIDVYL